MSYAIDNALFQWEDGERRLREDGGLEGPALAVLEELRRRLGSSFSLAELADLYAGGTDWAAKRTFDLVVSVFGAMFAPKPFEVAKEMVRVTKPGGRIVMGNWIPGDPTLVAQILRISSAYSPPPPEGFISPMTWGIEGLATERFAGAGVARENIPSPIQYFLPCNNGWCSL